MSGKLILALDLGVRTGFAFGAAREKPRSGTVTLKAIKEPSAVAFEALMSWLMEMAAEPRAPALVVKEAPLPLQAFRRLGNAAHTVRLTLALHGITEAVCHHCGIECVEEDNQTIRKHFLGQSSFGGRKATKAAVIARCHLLKLLPRDCFDEDRADALSVFDWAAAHLARTPPKALHMFGEERA